MTFEEDLRTLGLKAKIWGRYQLTESSEASNEGIHVRNLVARTQEGRVVRLETLDSVEQKQGEAFIQEKILELNSIYEPRREPYFAVLTNDSNYSSTDVLALYASDRMTYGTCALEQVAYRAYIAMLHCAKSRRAFIFESLVPLKLLSSTDDEGIDSVACP